MNKPVRIGLFDSGIGGLTVLRSLRHAIPNASYIYLGDTARTPYGTKGRDTIIRYAIECADFLSKHEIDLLVVACNTVSSYALDELSKRMTFPVIGVIDSASREAASVTRGKIGILGTEATIASRAYEFALQKLVPQAELFFKACPLFVPLVEQGMISGEIVDKVIELYLGEFRDTGVDTLLLGCTHYPVLTDALGDFFGNKINIVTCSQAVSSEVAGKISVSGEKTGGDTFYVTDDPLRFDRLAKVFLKESGISAHRVEL